jgi:hypothetical protein
MHCFSTVLCYASDQAPTGNLAFTINELYRGCAAPCQHPHCLFSIPHLFAGDTTFVFLTDAPASLGLIRDGLRALQAPGEATLTNSGFQQLPPANDGAALVQPSKAAVVTLMALAAGLMLSLVL